MSSNIVIKDFGFIFFVPLKDTGSDFTWSVKKDKHTCLCSSHWRPLSHSSLSTLTGGFNTNCETPLIGRLGTPSPHPPLSAWLIQTQTCTTTSLTSLQSIRRQRNNMILSVHMDEVNNKTGNLQWNCVLWPCNERPAGSNIIWWNELIVHHGGKMNFKMSILGEFFHVCQLLLSQYWRRRVWDKLMLASYFKSDRWVNARDSIVPKTKKRNQI